MNETGLLKQFIATLLALLVCTAPVTAQAESAPVTPQPEASLAKSQPEQAPVTAQSEAAPVTAQSEAATLSNESNQERKPADAPPADSPKGRVLQGGVKGTAVTLDEGLSRIDEASNLIKDECLQIIKESTRKDTVVMRAPNVLPGGIVIPALGGQGGVLQMGELPIRRDKLNRFVDNTEQTIAALHTYVDALIFPESDQDALRSYAKLKDTMQNAQDHLEALKTLSSVKRLINNKIAREALVIHDAMDNINSELVTLRQFVYTSP